MQVYIVDDEPAVHETLALTLRSRARAISSFLTPESFLQRLDGIEPGVVLLDLNMPSIDGLAVQRIISEKAAPLAVLFLTGVGDVPDAVNAVRNGAVDFLRKPYRRHLLFEALDRAEGEIQRLMAECERRRRLQVLERLTPREREILSELASGRQSKVIAHALGISTRTVEMHRANISNKLRTSITGALMLAQEAGLLRIA